MIEKTIKNLKKVSGYVLLSLIALLVLSMILGAVSVFRIFYDSVTSPDPYYMLIYMKDLYVIFNSILVIVVGYELLKSISHIIEHHSIPVRTILKIAIIAIANKVITLDVKSTETGHLIGIAIIITSLGISYFLYTKNTANDND